MSNLPTFIMEQIYMIEIFIDTVSLFSEDASTAQKNLIVTIKFGPRIEFVIKEGSFSNEASDGSNVTVERDDTGRQIVKKTLKVGKALFFPSFPDTVLQCLENFPFEIAIWNDDENEVQEFIGKGFMKWDTRFYDMLREAADPSKDVKPISINQVTTLLDECCCGRVGNISFILRLSVLGASITTTFEEKSNDPNSFIFTTDNKNLYQGKRLEGEDINFVAVGSLYHSISIQDTKTYKPPENLVTICTALDSCATDTGELQVCGKPKSKPKPSITKIRMGDIRGPCGNVNCALAQKIKRFLRKTDAYKKQAGSAGQSNAEPSNKSKKIICGVCGCHKYKWHRKGCPDNKDGTSKSNVLICVGCGGVAKDGATCNDIDGYDDDTPYDTPRELVDEKANSSDATDQKKALCGAFDCICRDEIVNQVTRLKHKSFCPSYKHKPVCPVMTMKQETGQKVEDDDEEKEAESPNGLEPLKLGPCPVVGRPCCNQGFEKMAEIQKKRQQAGAGGQSVDFEKLPPSYNDAGKICCSKEFERIKYFLKTYMEEDLQDDYRCFNQIDEKSEKCCEKEQIPGRLIGADCCGTLKKD